MRYKDFLIKLEGCVERHAPLKKLKNKELKVHNKPWITPLILNKIKHRDSIFARSKADPDNVNLRTNYKKFRNAIIRDIKLSKRNYYSNYFDSCKNNMKKTWKGINELISSRFHNSNINHLNVNEEVITDSTLIANAFNDFFVNVGPNTEKSIPKCPKSPLSFMGSRIENDFMITPTSNQELMILLLQLDESKSSDIPINLLKTAAPIIVPQLVELFNLSFSNGQFPNLMKLAKVVPIFKTGSTSDVNNYRPISLLPIFSKLIEKLMHNIHSL